MLQSTKCEEVLSSFGLGLSRSISNQTDIFTTYWEMELEQSKEVQHVKSIAGFFFEELSYNDVKYCTFFSWYDNFVSCLYPLSYFNGSVAPMCILGALWRAAPVALLLEIRFVDYPSSSSFQSRLFAIDRIGYCRNHRLVLDNQF